MSEMERTETKDKILKVALELFSKFGFNGTSVRDIAHASDVNVAAINYHFGSKHNLFWAVVNDSHNVAELMINEIADRTDNLEDLVSECYDHFMKEKEAVRTSFRILLTDGVPDPEGELKAAIEARMGPPGSPKILEILKKQLGKDIPEEKLRFAMNAIFAHLFHWCLICSTSKIETIRKNRPDLQPSAIKQSLRLHTRAICQFISSSDF